MKDDDSHVDDSAQQLLEAASTVIDLLDKWAEAEVDYLIEHPAGDAISAMCALATSRFPSTSGSAIMDLFIKIHDVRKHWLAYVEDDVADPVDGMPTSEFWEAIQQLKQATDYAKIPERPPLESVQELWRQMEHFPGRAEAIARIYGYTVGNVWRGPFFDAAGRVLSHLVQKEADKPNSVLPKDWVPESEKQRRDKEAKLAAENLAKAKLLLKKEESRPKVADLLNEGQFPDVIARVCGVLEPDVRQTAARLGIKIVEREDMLSGVDSIAAADPVADSRGYEESSTTTGQLAEQVARPAALKQIETPALELALTELLETEPEITQGAACAALTERGLSVKSADVRAALKRLRG